jgi:hypothetical protein
VWTAILVGTSPPSAASIATNMTTLRKSPMITTGWAVTNIPVRLVIHVTQRVKINTKIMRYFFITLFFVFSSMSAFSQNQKMTGKISYVSSQNIYVKFISTENIEIGDTLYVEKNTEKKAALIVNQKSSTSCVCTPLTDMDLKKDDDISFFPKPEIPVVEEDFKTETLTETTETIPTTTVPVEEEQEELYKQKIKGRLSAASYSTDSEYGSNHRMRYGFSFRGYHLKNSRFSFENNIIFRHTIGEWSEVQDNLADALKVYGLAGSFDIDKTSSVTLGRKINPKLSSMGAIDGVQYEKGFGQFIFGAIAGTRPDFSDYGFNPNLIQAGAFVSHISTEKQEQTTLAFAEQHNGGAVDRRFVYFQHSSSPVKNLNLFGSAEMDIFQNVNGEQKSEPQLTNLYVSARYRFSRKFSLNLSYDNRRNIIFYESYKSFIENLIDQETRQGMRAGLSVRPFKYVTFGANASWRFQKSDMNLSKNLNTYINISRVPFINARMSIRANFLETNYLKSQVYAARISKDIIKNKIGLDAYFRWVDYQYLTSDYSINQKVVGANLNIRLAKKLSLYLYGEQTFDNLDRNLIRINSKIIRRF